MPGSISTLRKCCLGKKQTIGVSIWHSVFEQISVYIAPKSAQRRLVCDCSEIGARKIVLACHLLIQL